MEKRIFKPVKLADSLQNINKHLINKFGKIDYVIHSKWAEIVGSYFVQHSQPEKIIIIPKPSEVDKMEQHEKILQVKVAPAASLEFQHFPKIYRY